MPITLLAHHSREYVQLEGYTTAKKGQKVFYIHYDYFVPDHNNPKLDHYEITPGMSYGITDRLMIDCHTHFAKFGSEHITSTAHRNEPVGPSPFIESAAFTLQYRITEPKQLPVDIAASILYEYPFSRSKRLLDGASVVETTVIVSRDLGKEHRGCPTIVILSPKGEESHLYFRRKARFFTSFRMTKSGLSDNLFSVLPGIQIPLEDTFILKTCLGFGNEKSGEELRFHISFMTWF